MQQHSGDTSAPTVSYRRSIDISTEAFLAAVGVASGASEGHQGHPVDAVEVAWGLLGTRVARDSATYRGGPPRGVSRYAVHQKARQLVLRHVLDTFDGDTWLPSGTAPDR